MLGLFSYIKTFHPKPIIAYSPYLKDPHLREAALESGVDYVLMSPINTDQLVEAVADALDRFRLT
jgi:CheY-like chemotaxis protein